jgi:uncharacterized membrane protein YgcG
MNEQQLADALAEQLDTMFAGEAPPPTSSNELTELLQVANQLSAAAPTPRPEFGATLKASLLQSASGSAVAGGTTLTGTILTIVFGGIIVVVVTLGLVSNNFLAPTATSTSESRPAPMAVPTSTAVVQPTINPTPTVENTPTQQPAITNPATNTLILPSPPATAILDMLPPITDTVEPGEELIFPPAELLPGQSSTNNDDDDGNSGGSGSNSGGGGSDDDDGGSSGDGNRGHGNDADGHDEDNPGNKR